MNVTEIGRISTYVNSLAKLSIAVFRTMGIQNPD